MYTMNRPKTRPSPTRRDFLKLSALWTLEAALLSTTSIPYARDVEPEWVQTKRIHLPLAGLPEAFAGYRIAQVSDIHMGDWMDRPHLDEVVARVNALQPDLIALTGDFVTREAEPFAQDLVAALGALRATNGVFAVLGNHDQSHHEGAVRRVLKESGITELRNSVQTLQKGRDLLHLCGVDDVWYGKADLDAVLGVLPTDGCAILLAHEPDFADTSGATGRFALQLSGHSHGGQVVVPFVGPTRLPPLGQKYHTGLYRVGDMLQYTNRGVGMVRPHVRFNCRPEITLLTLETQPGT